MITDGLVAYWKLEESGNVTTLVDSSGKNKTASITVNTQSVEGINGLGRKMRPGQNISASNVVANVKDVTLSTWYRQDTNATSTIPYMTYILGLTDYAASGVSAGVSSGNMLTISQYGTGGHTITESGIRVILGVWNHIALRKTGTKIDLFLNGKRILTRTISHTPGPHFSTSYMNAGSAAYFNLNGSYDEITVHNRSLSDAEISELALNRIRSLILKSANTLYSFKSGWKEIEGIDIQKNIEEFTSSIEITGKIFKEKTLVFKPDSVSSTIKMKPLSIKVE